MKFWDTSAILPLLVTEVSTQLRQQQYDADPSVVVWFGTLAEIESALTRRKREGGMPGPLEFIIRARLAAITSRWIEVAPTNEVRTRAIRLLRTHALRSADAFQLAAALIFCREQTSHLPFLTADLRLRSAADAEGFLVE